MENSPTPRPRSIVGPVILILIGLIFLANNLGLLGWSVWSTLWRLWPVLLIAAGVDIMFGRRSNWGGWVAGGIAILVIGGTLAFSPLIVRDYGIDAVQAVAEPLGSTTRADVTVAPGLGHLIIREARDGAMLAEGTLARFQGEDLRVSHRGNNGSSRLEIRSEGFKGIPATFGPDHRWDLGLNGSVPMRLDLDLGVGKSELDLSRLNLTGLQINTGVGETDIILPATGQFAAKIDSGVGKISINIPRGMAVRINAEQGIGSIDYRGEFVQRGGYRESPDYGTAKNRIDLRIQGGIGAIDISMR